MRRYLIVIDDIWDKGPRDKVIGLALIENNIRSRTIATTRIIDVAEHIGDCYRLKPLSYKSSDMLFYGRIFGSKDKCPARFLDVSEKILKKCGGVPLAIVTTSSLLANKSENIKVWHDVCDSIGAGLGRNPGMDDMRKILLLSYYDLPSHLKTCLLYLSIFPEDYEITKDVLIWRWVAEGFVQEKKGDQSFLEIGQSYFNELVNRSLVQPIYMADVEGRPKACRVHDTVLDLIISLSVEECFITTVLGDGMESKEVRRLSLHNSTTWPTMKMPKLRSLTIFKSAGVEIDPTPSLSCYHLLRVLDLRGCKLYDIARLGFLGSLSHIRYLGLSTRSYGGIPDQLPVEIGKLRCLQTLDVSDTEVEELPSSVVEGLGQLLCLRGRRVKGTNPDGLEKLTSLEVLESGIVISKCFAEELGPLTQLRVLDVKVKVRFSELDDEALVKSLGKLTKIESLQIIPHSGGHLYSANIDGSMAEPLANLRRLQIDLACRFLPTWIRPASLPGLSYLDIVVEYERNEDIQVLGTLPCLRHLRFIVMYAPDEMVQKRCVVGPDAFPCVVRCEFDLQGTGTVPGMFPRGAMPRLQDFTFRIEREQLWKKGGRYTLDDLVLDHLPSIVSVSVVGLYSGYNDSENKKDMIRRAREKLEHEAAAHPNHPRIRFKWTNKPGAEDDNVISRVFKADAYKYSLHLY